MFRTAALDKLAPQALNDSIEHRKRPAPLEDTVWSLTVRRLVLVAVFADTEIQPHNHSTTSFLRALPVSFVRYEEFQRCQKKAPETPLFRVGAIKIPPFQHTDEEV